MDLLLPLLSIAVAYFFGLLTGRAFKIVTNVLKDLPPGSKYSIEIPLLGAIKIQYLPPDVPGETDH